ncbi:MAG: hypothetical protein H0U57_06690 [Tatlockia sp.]|nr:hypothetical protein [Tatlockia sp.]
MKVIFAAKNKPDFLWKEEPLSGHCPLRHWQFPASDAAKSCIRHQSFQWGNIENSVTICRRLRFFKK